MHRADHAIRCREGAHRRIGARTHGAGDRHAAKKRDAESNGSDGKGGRSVNRRATALLVAALAIAACRNGGPSFAELLGISDKPAPHAMAIDILCDPSRGST